MNGSGARSASFVIPTTGETSANVWYRIHLEVRDSSGRTNSTFRDVLPRKSMISLATSPAGLQLTLDGQPTGATTVEGVVGIQRTIGALATQTIGGIWYDFVSWSDGGAATHTMSTPASATTYTATYRQTTSGCTVPGAPLNLVAVVNGTTLTIRWSPPATGPQPTSYRAEYGTASGQTQQTGTLPGSTTSASGHFAARSIVPPPAFSEFLRNESCVERSHGAALIRGSRAPSSCGPRSGREARKYATLPRSPRPVYQRGNLPRGTLLTSIAVSVYRARPPAECLGTLLTSPEATSEWV